MEKIQTEVVVLGSGPGGYSAAFRISKLGKKVVIIEEKKDIGGVCLNVGCIPSKTLLHITKVVSETKTLQKRGIISLSDLQYNRKEIIEYKKEIIQKLVKGLQYLCRKRQVKVIRGFGTFKNKSEILVRNGNEEKIVKFKSAIVSIGSEPRNLSYIPKDSRIMDSTKALEIQDIPRKMLIIGAGIIGLEMAQIYQSLGSDITIVESGQDILNSVDEDITKHYRRIIQNKYQLYLKTQVSSIISRKKNLEVTFVHSQTKKTEYFDKILLAVGRSPNSHKIQAEKAGIEIDNTGFIKVDRQLKTNVKNIYAIGDVTGQPMLAHKAVAQGKIVAEVICDKKHFFEPKVIPSVTYTEPEIAWVGMTEKEALEKNIQHDTAIFPWLASGRSVSSGKSEGFTKLIFNKRKTIIGGIILGSSAGELISEITLAIEMGCHCEDISLSIHPHPTLSESIMIASEIYEGTCTDL